MPLTSKGSEIMSSMREQYGEKKGEQVFYATNTECAYLAGILDGEGCISVAWRGGGKTAGQKRRWKNKEPKKYLTPTVQVTNTSVDMISWLHNRYGGSVYLRMDRRPTRCSPSWLWSIAGQKAIRVVRDARPYLVVKHLQADILLNLPRQSTKERDALGRIVGKMTEADFAANHDTVIAIRRLNKRGPERAYAIN